MCGVFKKPYQLTAVCKFECHKSFLHASLTTGIQKQCVHFIISAPTHGGTALFRAAF